MTRKQVGPKFKDGWGETIQDLCNLHGYSVSKLADKLKVSKSTVSKWESEAMVPRIDIALKLAELLKVDIETIFDI